MSSELKALAERLAAIEKRSPRSGRDGRDGRDGTDGVSELGERGLKGDRGQDGTSVDPLAVAALIAKEVAQAVELIPPARDGVDGRDADPALVLDLVRRFVGEIPTPPTPKDGVSGPRGQRGPKGDSGIQGDQGDDGPIGPMPDHDWDGTKLRFQRPDGHWGEAVDLKGERGFHGQSGGGGSSAPTLIHSYFPNGW